MRQVEGQPSLTLLERVTVPRQRHAGMQIKAITAKLSAPRPRGHEKKPVISARKVSEQLLCSLPGVHQRRRALLSLFGSVSMCLHTAFTN